MSQSNRNVDEFIVIFGTIFGLIISIPINLFSTCFQQNILSNRFVLIITVIALLFIFYYIFKRQYLLLLIALLIFVANVAVNLVSNWIQHDFLHNSFTPTIVLAVIVSPIIYFFVSGWLKPHSSQSVNKQLATLRSEGRPNETQQKHEHKLAAQQRKRELKYETRQQQSLRRKAKGLW
jgi:hypothetical protein